MILTPLAGIVKPYMITTKEMNIFLNLKKLINVGNSVTTSIFSVIRLGIVK